MPGQVLTALLDYLATTTPQTATDWDGWTIMPIVGGANNLLYRVTRAEDDLAVKFVIRDTRDRAGREYRMLAILQAVGFALAPRPVLLECEQFPQPVVVQTWLPGIVTDAPPDNDTDWRSLIEHFVALHGVDPMRVTHPLPAAVLDMRSVEQGRHAIEEQLARIPCNERSSAISGIVLRINRLKYPSCNPPTATLCKGDPNINNFVRHAGPWESVDWEYSGWGDPAFEMADLLTHPTYLSVSDARREWVIDTYCACRADATIATRIRAYMQLMLVWGAARLTRSLYEAPRGLDARLAVSSPTWQAETEAKCEHYLRQAQAALS